MLAALAILFGNLGDRLILWPTTNLEDRHGAVQLFVPFGNVLKGHSR